MADPPDLIETMRTVAGDVPLLGAHYARYRRSARSLGYRVADWRREALDAAERLGRGVLRAQVSPEGRVEWSARPLAVPSRPMRIGVSDSSVPYSPLLQHKNTRRSVYERAAQEASRRGLDAVVLVNASSRLTETSIHTLLYRLEGQWWTPPLADGLVAGVVRGELLRRGVVGARSITRDQALRERPRIALCNAVVGVVAAVWAAG